MATLLLLIIYLAFIGLGIPDSLLGTAWPAIYPEFQIPLSYASFVTVIVSCGTVFSSLFSAQLISRFGTGKVSFVSTLLTAIALIGYSFSPNIWCMCLLAVPLGMGAGGIDIALNNYVALHYSATHMSFLHCFYGVGVSISPYVMSRIITGSQGWRGGYRVAFILQMTITVVLLVTLPLWNKVHQNTREEQEVEAKVLSFPATLRIKGVKSMCCLLITSCAIEFICGNWGSTFLVEYRGMAVDGAATVITFYYMGIALGRFISGLLASKLHPWQIIRLGQITLGIALLLLFVPGGPVLSAAALLMVGTGNGALVPNFTYLAPENFGKDLSQSVISVQMASSYIGIMFAPLVCGILGQQLGMGIFPILLLLAFLGMMLSTYTAKKAVNYKTKR